MKYLAVAGLALLMAGPVIPPPAEAAGFNCWASRSATEATICASPELSRLDIQLNRAYARSDVSISSQRAWLRRRDRCGVREGCIRAMMVQRIRELRD